MAALHRWTGRSGRVRDGFQRAAASSRRLVAAQLQVADGGMRSADRGDLSGQALSNRERSKHDQARRRGAGHARIPAQRARCPLWSGTRTGGAGRSERGRIGPPGVSQSFVRSRRDAIVRRRGCVLRRTGVPPRWTRVRSMRLRQRFEGTERRWRNRRCSDLFLKSPALLPFRGPTPLRSKRRFRKQARRQSAY